MHPESRKIKSFTDLIVWQNGHRAVLDIYKITGQFLKEEQCGLTSQLRRSAVSFTSNIAEGFSRTSPRDKARFYAMALGSLTEAQNQLLVARDIGYLETPMFRKIADQTVELNKMTKGLIKKTPSLLLAS